MAVAAPPRVFLPWPVPLVRFHKPVLYFIYANTARGKSVWQLLAHAKFLGSRLVLPRRLLWGRQSMALLRQETVALPFDGSLLDAYTFSGTAGQQIAISQTSSAFDAFLILLSPTGTAIAALMTTVPEARMHAFLVRRELSACLQPELTQFSPMQLTRVCAVTMP